MAVIIDIIASLLEALYDFTGNYGVAIIILSVIIRLATLPLTASQTRSMKRMQELQPEIKKLQKKYKNDPQTLNQKTLELFREHNYNPLGGCLPILIQLPILYFFFLTLREYDFTGNPAFIWVPDLAAPDPLYVLPILTAVTTYLVTKLTSAKTQSPDGMQGMQTMMLYFMPLFLGYLATQLAAGLALYWVVTNIFQIAQTYYIEWADARREKGATQ